jgi:hypothetical protein
VAKRKPRFVLRSDTIPAGSVNDDVEKVQLFLERYGHLRERPTPKELDEETQKALRSFQRTMGLRPTGEVDVETKVAIERPRCGTPDLPKDDDGPVAGFSLRGCSYQARFRTLTFAFLNGTPDISGNQERQAIRNAFATWQAQIPIDFVEVATTNNPNFTIGWFSGDHGDGNAFDGSGNTLAHAFYPPPCGGQHFGKMHFDEAESWTLNGADFDTETVALHEIGHLIGLNHSTVPGSVMFASYGGQRRALTQDDIDGARAMYGRRGPAMRVLVHLENIGDRVFRDNEFAGTRGESRRLEGFELSLNPAVPGLGMRYMAHLQGQGDVPFVNEGQFIGTRGQSRRLEGFAIELTGPQAANHNVFYMAHLQNLGDTPLFTNGQFCGTRGQSRRVEGILVRIEPR